MNTRQTLSSALVVVLCLAAGCSRADTQQEARQVAAELKTAARRAGDQLADSWLTTKVQAQYFADEDIKSRYIDVSSRDGVVTLTGFVESDEVRQQALQIAKNTDGVRQIEDGLRIGQSPANAFVDKGASSAAAVGTTGAASNSEDLYAESIAAAAAAARVDDASITSMIQAKFFLDSGVKARAIDVETRAGVVTLRGDVASDAERAQALLLARATDGVQRVEDALTVNAAVR